MNAREKQRLFFDDTWLDAKGTVIPTREAHESVEVEYPDATDAEKWRLAIAATLISKAKLYFGRPVTTTDVEAFVSDIKRYRGEPDRT